jgi:lysozyme
MTSGAREQYALYSSVLDKVGPDLLPMVDVETLDRKTVNELQDSLAVFLNLLEKDYGKKPMIYGTNYSYNKFCAPRFNKYPLYIGRYGDAAPVIRGVGTYTIWQYSDSTVLPGCKKPIDVCRFHKEKSLADILL